MLTLKKSAQALILGLSALTLNNAWAHGAAKPQHGGVVQVANDVNFELVLQADGALIYLIDHDEPMSSAGITGKLTVLSGASKTEAELKPAGDNKLQAIGIKIGSGAKVVASLSNVEGKAVTVRFAIK
ncbi:hypothetical protein [Roseateles oligotrophus]|uniref:Uncharacterized protein n=1 Tax=Roseateles oligotrophus TaxID=1769250 RepID=A0ABT2YCU4_9BURK|nr:hypothetical protein [Roseateles oligotrophus]MCV2367864.1 hypothetical protein [Roseateles oligotrophus]